MAPSLQRNRTPRLLTYIGDKGTGQGYETSVQGYETEVPHDGSPSLQMNRTPRLSTISETRMQDKGTKVRYEYHCIVSQLLHTPISK